MTYWRQAGLNYLQYSSIAAKVLRQAIKPQVKRASPAPSILKITHWSDGKAVKEEVKVKA